MRIFITGGTGFLGTHLVRKLHAEGHRLLLLTTKPRSDPSRARLPGDASVVEGNLADIDRWRNELEEFQPEATVHLAWENIPDYRAETSIRNLTYGLNLFAALTRMGCPLILAAGSGWEYGLEGGKKSEDLPPRPFNAFGAAKTALQWLGAELAKERNLRFIWTRIFYVYGPGQRPESLTPYIIRCVQAGKNPELKNPHASNDFIYVGDVVGAISALVKNCRESGIYNIGSGRPTSVQEVVAAVFQAYRRPIAYQPSRATRLPTDAVSAVWADIARTTRDAHWQPTTTIAEGVRKMIERTPEG